MDKESRTERETELLGIVGEDPVLRKLATEAAYLESELDKLRDMPKIKVHPNNPERQKATASAKLYREYLQQYTNIIKVLTRATNADDGDETSPLRAWMEQHLEE